MGIVLDILIALLMLVTIGFCYRLSKKITVLSSSRKEMSKFLQDFDEAIARAEQNINELKAMGTQVDETLKQQLKKARFLANDLSFLTDKGETIAENLERKLSDIKSLSRPSAAPENNYNQPSKAQNNYTQIQTNRKPIHNERPENPQNQHFMSPSKKQALESILEEISKRRSINPQLNKVFNPIGSNKNNG